MSIDTILTLIAIFALWNVTVFCVYAFDKLAAREGAWRVREDTLILLAVAGGGIGAFACQRLMRHKTRKPPLPRPAAAHGGAAAWNRPADRPVSRGDA